MPDFESALTFVTGGGGGVCPGVDGDPNSIEVAQRSQWVSSCFWLRGVDINQPFRITLSQTIDPNAPVFTTPNLTYNPENQGLRWEGYPLPGNNYANGDVSNKGDVLAVYDLDVWAQVDLTPGQWRYSVIQNESSFGEFSQNFYVKGDNRPNLTAIGTHPIYELVPFSAVHTLMPGENHTVDVMGTDFPRNTPVYILVYREIAQGTGDMVLESKQVTVTNAIGSFTIGQLGSFEPGQVYTIVGLSDPATSLVKEDQVFNQDLPYDRFLVLPPN